MSLLDTAIKLHNFAEARRDKRRRDLQFAFQVVSWGVNARQDVSKLLDLQFHEETRDERQALELEEIRAKRSGAELHIVNSYVEREKAYLKAAKINSNDPEAQAAIGQMRRENYANFYNTTPDNVRALVSPDREMAVKDYIKAHAVSTDSVRKGLSATENQILDGTMEDAVLASQGKLEELVKKRPDASTVARAVLRLEEMPETIVDLKDTHKERAKTILDRSIAVFKEMENVDTPLLDKQIIAIQQATKELGEEPNEALRFALTQAVAQGMDQHIIAEKQRVVTMFDGEILSNRVDAAFAMSERGVSYYATLDTASLLNELKEHDFFKAYSYARDIANSGKDLGEVREDIESQMGMDLLKAVKIGSLNPNGPAFRKQVYIATLDKLVTDAAYAGVDLMAVHKVAQQMKQEINSGTLNGEGAMWTALDAVYQNIQKGLPNVIAEAHQHKEALQNEAATLMREGHGIAIGKTSATGSEAIVAVVPMVTGGVELAQRISSESLSFTRNITEGISKDPLFQTLFANHLLPENYFGKDQSGWYHLITGGDESLKHNWTELRRLVNKHIIRMGAGQSKASQRPEHKRIFAGFSILDEGYNAIADNGEFDKSIRKTVQRNFPPEQQEQLRRGLLAMRANRNIIVSRMEGPTDRHTQAAGVAYYDGVMDVFQAIGLTNANLGIKSTLRPVQPKIR